MILDHPRSWCVGPFHLAGINPVARDMALQYYPSLTSSLMKTFISHSSHNSAKALAIAQWLEEQGLGRPFLDIGPSHGLAPANAGGRH